MIGRLVEHPLRGWSIVAERVTIPSLYGNGRLTRTWKLFSLEDDSEFFDNEAEKLNSKDSPKRLNNYRWLDITDTVYLNIRKKRIEKVMFLGMDGEKAHLLQGNNDFYAPIEYVRAYQCIFNKVGKNARKCTRCGKLSTPEYQSSDNDTLSDEQNNYLSL